MTVLRKKGIDGDDSVVAEAQAMISEQYQLVAQVSTIPEEMNDIPKSDILRRKSSVDAEVDAAASNTLSPRQKLSDALDFHHSGSPLLTYSS